MDDILHVAEGQAQHWGSYGLQTGAVLTMRDGSRWFHPYSGGQPRRMPWW